MSAQPLILDRLSRSVLDSGQEKRTMAPLTCTFLAGRLHVVSGPSGAGKTTLLSLLALAVPPSGGLLHWGRENLTALSPAAAMAWRRTNLGMIFQTSRLVSVMTALENACFGGAIRGFDVQREALRLLDGFGLAGRRDQSNEARCDHQAGSSGIGSDADRQLSGPPVREADSKRPRRCRLRPGWNVTVRS